MPILNNCGCWTCLEDRSESVMFMILCPDCGNKRCPRANYHANPCTGSNEPGQPGSAYEEGSGAATARRFTHEARHASRRVA